MAADDSMTRASLLLQLQREGNDSTAWQQFVERYSPKILAWCRRWQVSGADADDISQMVLMQLARKLRNFRYDPKRSFRAWLKTLTRHALSDFFSEQQPRNTGAGDSAVASLLSSLEARADLENHLNESFDREVLDQAMSLVQARVQPTTWEAFRLTALESQSGSDAAAQLDMQVAAVYMAKSNVQKLLRAEIARLENEEQP